MHNRVEKKDLDLDKVCQNLIYEELNGKDCNPCTLHHIIKNNFDQSIPRVRNSTCVCLMNVHEIDSDRKLHNTENEILDKSITTNNMPNRSKSYSSLLEKRNVQNIFNFTYFSNDSDSLSSQSTEASPKHSYVRAKYTSQFKNLNTNKSSNNKSEKLNQDILFSPYNDENNFKSVRSSIDNPISVCLSFLRNINNNIKVYSIAPTEIVIEPLYSISYNIMENLKAIKSLTIIVLVVSTLTLILRFFEKLFSLNYILFLRNGFENVYENSYLVSNSYKYVENPVSLYSEFFNLIHIGLDKFVENGNNYNILAIGICLFIILIIILIQYNYKKYISSSDGKSLNSVISLHNVLMYYSILKLMIKTISAVLFFTIIVNVTSFFFGGVNSKAFAFPDIYLGYIFSSTKLAKLTSIGYINLTLFVVGFIIDSLGFIIKYKIVSKYTNKKIIIAILTSIVLVLGIASIFLSRTPICNSNDNHWLDFTKYTNSINTNITSNHSYPPVHISQYIPISKNERAAVDIYLPTRYYKYIHKVQNLLNKNRTDNDVLKLLINEEDKLVTFINVTRYNRSTALVWPFSILSVWGQTRSASANVWSYQFQQNLVSNNYAVVHVDTRGTGASSGNRPIDLGHAEIQDLSIIVDWVKKQWWSNNLVAAGGISYDGMTGVLSSAHNHVNAIVSLFTPMDVLSTLISPGGSLCSSFVGDYTGLTTGFEKNGSPVQHILKNAVQYPLHVILGFLTTFGGAVGVKGYEHNLNLSQQDHLNNWEMVEMVEQIQFIDDVVTLNDNTKTPLRNFGLHDNIIINAASNQVHSYIVGGYCDSSSVQGASSLYNFMKKHNPNSVTKLTIGSWSHGGKRNCSPYSGSYSCFEKSMYYDAVRFLDCTVKKKCWGNFNNEQNVHFWQVSDEKWIHSNEYPPKNIIYMDNSNEEKTKIKSTDYILNFSSLKYTKNDILDHLDIKNYKLKHRTPDLLVNGLPRKGLLQSWTHLEHYIHDVLQSIYIKILETRVLKKYFYSNKLLQNDLLNKEYVPYNTVASILHHDKNAYKMLPLKNVSVNNNISAKTNSKNILDENNSETVNKNEINGFSSAINYQVDYRATTGKYSRWFIAQHPFGVPVYYGNRLLPSRGEKQNAYSFAKSWMRFAHENNDKLETDEEKIIQRENRIQTQLSVANLLSWTSHPLDSDIKMIGIPEIKFNIFVKNCSDFFVFVYLEDVDLNTGLSHYVSEGNLMPTHRKNMYSNENFNSFSILSTGRDFTRGNYKPVDPNGENMFVDIKLQPISWTFKKGHAIRISFAGNDVDNFDVPDSLVDWLPTQWTISIDEDSQLILPVIEF